MKTIFHAAAMVLLLLFACTGTVWAGEDDGSIVKITQPQNGQTVTEPFEVTYELRKGTHGDHAHVYVDGKYQKGFKGTLQGIGKGTHEITVKVADHDHEVLAASDSITVEVQ